MFWAIIKKVSFCSQRWSLFHFHHGTNIFRLLHALCLLIDTNTSFGIIILDVDEILSSAKRSSGRSRLFFPRISNSIATWKSFNGKVISSRSIGNGVSLLHIVDFLSNPCWTLDRRSSSYADLIVQFWSQINSRLETRRRVEKSAWELISNIILLHLGMLNSFDS